MHRFVLLPASFVVIFFSGCAGSRYTRVEVQRPFPEVRTAIERYCEPIRAAGTPFGGPWLSQTNASEKEYEVIIWDKVWSGPPTVTTVIAAIRRAPDKTELRIRTCDKLISFSTGRKRDAEKERATEVLALLDSR